MDTKTGTAARTLLYPRATGHARLRVCVLLAAHELPAWLDETLGALLAAEFLEVQVVRTAVAPARRRGSVAWRAFHALDHRLLGGLRAISAPRPLPPALANAPFPEGEAALQAMVAAIAPDVLLSIGQSPVPVPLWPLARRAAWSLPAEACGPGFGLLHLLPAFLRGETCARSGLPVFDDRRGGHLLLDPAVVSVAQLSFARNSAYQLQKAPAKLLRELRRLQQEQPLRAMPHAQARPPGILATLGLCARLLARSALRHLPRFGRRERWTLASRRGARGLDPAAPDARDFQLWTPPRGWFWADPFPWSHRGAEHVFFEAYDYARGIGEIHVVPVDAEGRAGPVQRVMHGPRHLSYPFLFEHAGNPHLLVECSQSRRIDAFRSTDWPTGWVHAATLIDGWRAVDGTVVRHGDRWWLFACVAETPFDDGGREFNELFLFHANDPLGPWHPHRQNPVVTDVRRARPAGPCFVHEGRLVRPAQDCAAEYGHRIVFNEVRRLDPDHYEEHPIGQLDPRWAVAMHGCHTYARHGTLDLLDAKFLAPVAETRPSRP